MHHVQRLRQVVSILPVLVATLTLACSEGVTPSNGSVHGAPNGVVGGGVAANIQVSPATTSLEEGAGSKLSCNAFDSRDVSVSSTRSWTSSDPSVATVGSDGTVTAIGAGSAVASCTVDGKTATATINVAASPVAFVEVSPG